MGDTVAVGDDKRRARIGFGLTQGLQCLLRVGTKGDAGNIDVAVGDGLQRHILLGQRLAPRRELGDGAERGRFRHLAAGVGVDLGIHHQHVHIAPGGEHMIEPRRADVIGPAIAADDPDRAAHQLIDKR
ncbi:hypothetical protein D3C84_750360 [compost metagenome]